MIRVWEDLAIEADHRSCGPDTPPVLFLPDGSEFALPTRWVVCSVCGGTGSHVNPAIDAGGLSAEDFDQDPDFAEAYLGGAYDQTCNRCSGRTTVRTVDLDRLSPEHLALYERQLRDEDAEAAFARAERRMGA